MVLPPLVIGYDELYHDSESEENKNENQFNLENVSGQGVEKAKQDPANIKGNIAIDTK